MRVAGSVIRMTALVGLTGSPLTPLHDAVHLEPSGLSLLKPATLSLPLRPAPAPFVAFLYDANGDELHLVPWRTDGETVRILVNHFSGGGGAGGAAAATMSSFSSSNAQGRAEQRIADALSMLAAGSIDQARYEALVDQALRLWHLAVLNAFQIAQSGPLEFFMYAVSDWMGWVAMTEALDRAGATCRW